MVIFHSYVNLPEGIWFGGDPKITNSMGTMMINHLILGFHFRETQIKNTGSTDELNH
jgi:hypothetical protein